LRQLISAKIGRNYAGLNTPPCGYYLSVENTTNISRPASLHRDARRAGGVFFYREVKKRFFGRIFGEKEGR
jgi:hypothetical protein